MRKKILFYFVATLLLVLSFILFNNAYKELLRYAELTDRAHIVYSGFQNLSKQINDAAISNPVLIREGRQTSLFFADSSSVIRQLDRLNAIVRDSVNIEIARKLDTEVRAELSWLLKSDVPDSIVNHHAPLHIEALEHITSLIGQGMARTDFILAQRKEKLSNAFNDVIGWMIAFILIAVVLLFYTVLHLLRQFSKTKEKEKELDIKEKQFRNTLDKMLEGVQIHDFNWRYIYVNDALVNYSKYSREELLGTTVMEKYPGIEKTELFKAMQRSMIERITQKIETDFVFPDGTKAFFEVSIQPVPEGIFILSVDKSEQKRAKDKLEKMSRLYAFISAINQSIVHTGDEKELFDQACHIAIEIGEFTMAWIDLLNEETGKLEMISSHGIKAIMETRQKCSGLDFSSPLLEGTLTEKALRSGKYAVSNDVQNDPGMSPWKKELIQHGIKASISLPIIKSGKVAGVFGFHSAIENFFDEKEIHLLEEAAGDVSFALDIFEKAKQHKITEELVIKNEKRFRALIEKSTDMVTLSTVDGKMLYGSSSITRQFGYATEEIPQTLAFDFVHPEDLPGFIEKRKKILQTPGESFYSQLRLKHRNGNWVWCETVITNLLEEPGVNALVANFRDISDKKRAEEEQEFNKSNQAALINNTCDLMWSVDREFKLITFNEPFDASIQGGAGRTIKKGDDLLAAAYSPEQSQHFKTSYERAFAGESFTEMYNNKRNETWIEISYCPIHNGNEVIGAACHSRDITAIKKSELQLRRSELFNRGVLSSLSSHIAVVNNTGEIVAVNESWIKFALENGETNMMRTGVGTNYYDVCRRSAANGHEEASAALQGMRDVMDEKQEVFYLEYACHSPEKQRWFGMRVMQFYNDEPMVVVSHLDITERRLAEQNKEQSEIRLKEAQALAKLGNWEVNFEKNESLWSEETCRIYGIPLKENIQPEKSWLSYIHPADLEYVTAAVKESEASVKDTALDYRIVLKDGSIKHIHSISRFKYDNKGNAIGSYGITHDVTETKLGEEERDKMVADIIQRSNNLEQFAYIISHNLRGPVANMLGISHALQSEMPQDDRDKMQSFLFTAVDQLDEIIKDLVKILQTRSEITENKELIHFQELINVIESSIHNLVEKEDVKIMTEFSEIDNITTLKSYFHSIFYNLISNSIKYRHVDRTPVIKIKSCIDQGKLRIVFEDNGTGIDLDQHKGKVFGLYKRFHPNIEGKGLGLFMVKTQVEVLGGTIGIKSKPGVGTEFIIELPF